MAESGSGSSTPHGQDDFCAVTVVCGSSWIDVALPAGIPTGHLTPGLVRLLKPPDATSDAPDDAPTGADSWLLAATGRPELHAAETLLDAGVLDGEVLMLRSALRPAGPNRPVGGTLRDQVEQVVSGRGRIWTARTSAEFAAWIFVVAGAVLLVWPALAGTGLLPAGVDAVIAIVHALVAVTVARRSAAAAATALSTGCAWAGLAGWSWLADAPSGGVPTASGLLTPVGAGSAVVLATGCACLLAAAAVPVFPAALPHAAASTVMLAAACSVLALSSTGVPLSELAACSALVAVLCLGAAPRLVLALGGLRAGAAVPPGPSVDIRISRADRVLTGSIVGLTLVAVSCAMPAVLSTESWHQLLGGTVGVAILLRSRTYSQVPHVIGPRIGGIVVLGGLWVAVSGAAGLPAATVVLSVVVAGGAAAVGACLTSGGTPVARAMVSRSLDVVELLVVIVAVVLAAGVVGLFEWLGTVTGTG